MVKRCAWGTCNSDTRYPERLGDGIYFLPFPKPHLNRDKCLLWIKLCGRPQHQLNVEKINKDVYVCSKQPEEVQEHLHQHPPLELPSGEMEQELLTLSNISNYFRYCTGFTYDQFNDLCTVFAVPNTYTAPQTFVPLTYKRVDREINDMPLRHQLLLVLMKFHQNLELKDLAYRFQIPERSTGTLFNSWVDYMFGVLGELPAWPHRDTIISQMPDKYKINFGTTLAILDCTEVKIERPSSLVLQSQSFSNYKSTNTLKSLIACDPRGAIMFTSTLFTGSLSDKEIVNKSKFLDLLKTLISHSYLNQGDGVMVDKGFLIEKDLENIGLRVNIPPFAQSNTQMSAADVHKTLKFSASHTVDYV
ncbi:putative nuclease HARBI1 [Merluccius polli]|uniref:Nuclease HARBI1 n=1 Tax=Merluccius polli TaxID=89951 RepID=A0AA47MN75_MERPO|nr:putative nuclease HARBI1 [Merluccius polli]